MSYRRRQSEPWQWEAPSETCQVVTRWEKGEIAEQCGQPATTCYQAGNRGWMSLCHEHGRAHINYSTPIAIARAHPSEQAP